MEVWEAIVVVGEGSAPIAFINSVCTATLEYTHKDAPTWTHTHTHILIHLCL